MPKGGLEKFADLLNSQSPIIFCNGMAPGISTYDFAHTLNGIFLDVSFSQLFLIVLAKDFLGVAGTRLDVLGALFTFAMLLTL